MPDHPATNAPGQVAVLLPLSGRLGDAGETVRDGYLAAYYQLSAPKRPVLRIYDTASDAAAAFRHAVDDGSTFVVGPLSRDAVAAVRSVADGHVPVLALNHLADGEMAPKGFVQFGLAPEDDARQVALRTLDIGQRVGAVLVPSGDWGTRVRQAFSATFTAGGGLITATETYSTDTTDFADQLEQLLGFEESEKRYRTVSALVGGTVLFTPRRREDLEFIFFAGQPVHGRLVRPQLKFHFAGDLPVYATSDIYDPYATSNQDLEGVGFVDVPWLLSDTEKVKALRATVGALWPGDARRAGRLFALGFDACAIVERLRGGEPVDGMAGLTGTLSLGSGNRIRRTLQWATFAGDGSVSPTGG